MTCRFVALVVASLLLLLGSAPHTVAAPVMGQGTWESTLKARDLNGDGVADAYYDTALNITWLKNWRLSAPAPAVPFLSHSDAVMWAAGLTIGGHAGWRLPSLTKPSGAFNTAFSNNGSSDWGYAATGTGWGMSSELGHLFYVTLGNAGRCTPNNSDPSACVEQAVYGLTNTADFDGIMANGYWTDGFDGLGYYPGWIFDTYGGLQGVPWNYQGDRTPGLVTAVHTGDIGSAIPEPASTALVGIALAGLVVVSRRRQ